LRVSDDDRCVPCAAKQAVIRILLEGILSEDFTAAQHASPEEKKEG
jgi:hypothetical protein